MKASEHLKIFLDWLSECESEYAKCQEVVETENKRLQDFLHFIEFEESAKERSKECTKFKIRRRERRNAKDRMEVLEPVMAILGDKTFAKSRNQLTQALGQVRKLEKKQIGRKYHPRVKENNE